MRYDIYLLIIFSYQLFFNALKVSPSTTIVLSMFLMSLAVLTFHHTVYPVFSQPPTH